MLKLFKTTLFFFSFIISMTCGALAQIPNSPTQLVIWSKSASGFGLRWIDNSLNEQGFYIESKSPKEWRIVGIAPENATQFSVGGVWCQTTKQYRVCAYNQNGKSQPSNTVKGKTLDNYPNKRSHLIDSTGARNGEGCFIKLDNRLWMYYSYRLEGGDEGQSQIVRRYSDDNGQNWSKRKIVLKHPKLGYINPALVHLADNKIGLSYAEMVPHAAKAKRFFMASADGGKNWTNPVRIDNGEYDYNTGTHGRMYVLGNGRIINLVHSFLDKTNRKHLGTNIYASDDNGKTWHKKGETIDVDLDTRPKLGSQRGFYEAALVEYKLSKLLVYGRTATDWLWQVKSDDGGETWSRPVQTGIRAPVAPPFLAKIPNTDFILLIWNSYWDGEHWHRGERVILASMVSEDVGKTWKNYKEIEYMADEHADTGNLTWFDYPFLLWDDPVAHLAYRNSKNLNYIKLNIEWFYND